MHRLIGAEADRHLRPHRRTVDRTGIGVDPARQIRRDDRRLDPRHELRRLRPQRPAPGDADDAIDHQIRPAQVGPHPATGFPQRRKTFRMRTLRIQQHRIDRNTAAPQEISRPQCVPTVVAGADQQRHRPPRDTPGARPQLPATTVASP